MWALPYPQVARPYRRRDLGNHAEIAEMPMPIACVSILAPVGPGATRPARWQLTTQGSFNPRPTEERRHRVQCATGNSAGEYYGDDAGARGAAGRGCRGVSAYKG